jgi:hypothetical protein
MLAIGTLLLASVGIAAGAPPPAKAAPRAIAWLQASTYDEAACDAAIEAALSGSDALAPLDRAVEAGELEAECAPLVARALDQIEVACSLFGELPRACEAPARRLLLLRRPDTLRANRAHDAALRASADGPRCLPECAPPSARDQSAPMALTVAPDLPRAPLQAVTLAPPSESAPRDPPHGRLERPPR